MHNAKPPADDPRRAKRPADLLRVRIRGHVEVVRRAADDKVPHGAAHDVGMEARLAQATHNPNGVWVHEARIDPVLVLCVYVRLLLNCTVWRCSVSEKQAAIPVFPALFL